MAMSTFDTTKFSWVEVFLNTNGKTSSTKLIGLISSLVCMLAFIVLIVFYMFNMTESGVILVFMDKIITVFGIAAGLMGIKSISSSIGNAKTIIQNNEPVYETPVKPRKKKATDIEEVAEPEED